ncbi:lytic polysaccharide monooxygenase [Hyaloscypha hepaticicola]|uniref:AA9 family lytic polysaccharide monooxygenase n=1 Tax=Hyaloscypha hepaticicola TaxID=2082293 RepID=A0A2J6QPI4_9HELO|nr:lytic polysaccharide monooxygenase [Hyaloscypha hepaticicola]
MLFSALFSVAALLVAEASAYGAVTSYVIDGTTYPGYTGYSPASSPATIQRQWPDYNPTFTITDSKVMCNGGTSDALVANVTGGSAITAQWAQWTHQQGPIMVWLYKCLGDIKSCDRSGNIGSRLIKWAWLKEVECRPCVPGGVCKPTGVKVL